MLQRLLLLLAVLILSACGEDQPEIDEDKPLPPRKMTEHERILSARPPPVGMTRQRDPTTGISVAFATDWEVTRDETALYRAHAHADTGSGHGSQVIVNSFAYAGTLDEYLATLRKDTAATRHDVQEVVFGPRRLGDRDARTYRYTVPWKRGRTVEEVTILKQDGQLCVITGICHVDDRPTFATSYALILQSLQWTMPDAPR